MLIPIFLVFAFLIKMDSPGPVIFKQARVGLRGRQFYLFKFRTMVKNAEALKKELEKQNEMDGPAFKLSNDPRITNVGRLLRKTGLDEVPQFFNVLKGDMSFIGPRPPLASETVKYERWQLRRLSVKPGITCYWQIMPKRNEVKFDQWVKMDLAYIDRWSIKTDIKLFFYTIKTIFSSTGS
jgi:lipopolysaccharide/colanic/teichoic acid biosynthesis glycosyltransferase